MSDGKLPATIPVIFQDAVKALVACRTLDEAIYFRDKAEALKAWAKIHRLKAQEREARALTLYAFRRSHQLAKELHPQPVKKLVGRGFQPGVAALLRGHGFTGNEANAAARLGKMPAAEFEALAALPRPPTPTNVQKSIGRPGSSAWHTIAGMSGGPGLVNFMSWARRHDAAHLARQLDSSEAARARRLCSELSDWLDTFEQHLPKVKK